MDCIFYLNVGYPKTSEFGKKCPRFLLQKDTGMKEKTHIGELIRKKLEKEEREATWFARKLHYHPKSVYRIFKKQHINTKLLLNISIILNHDFFMYYSTFFDCQMNTGMKENTSIGELIHEKLKEEEREVEWFARKLHYDPTNIYKIFQKQHFDTELLLDISILLNYNFFMYYSDLFHKYKNS